MTLGDEGFKYQQYVLKCAETIEGDASRSCCSEARPVLFLDTSDGTCLGFSDGIIPSAAVADMGVFPTQGYLSGVLMIRNLGNLPHLSPN